MVYSGDREIVREYMEMGHERSKPLHNFTLPCLKWGNQRHLRCMKEESSGEALTVDHRLRRRSPPSKFKNFSMEFTTRRGESDQMQHQQQNKHHRRLKTVPSRSRIDGGEEGIDEVREKIMLDLKSVADKMKNRIFREEVSDEEEGPEEKEKERVKEKEKEKERDESSAATEEVRPWNLRTRRAACKAPIGGAGNNNNNNNQNMNNNNSNNRGLRIEERTVNYSPMRSEGVKSPRVRERERERGGGAEKKEKVKFSVPLTMKEIEQDFMEMVGHRPSRRPKKRPRNVQKQLDSLFPGLWLTEVTADSYKVPELAENGKR